MRGNTASNSKNREETQSSYEGEYKINLENKEETCKMASEESYQGKNWELSDF